VDIAIPFVYSYRAGQDWKNVEDLGDSEGRKIHHIDVASISAGQHPVDPEDVKQLAISIKRDGLLQPVVLTRKDGTDRYDIMAGQLRLEACKQLGWRTVPALVRNGDGQPRSISIPPGSQPPMAS
jgi:ParB-like chromosome segregation protein Spo0J